MINMEPNMSLDDVNQWLRDGWFLFRPTTRHKMRVGCVNHWKESLDDFYLIKDLGGETFEVSDPEECIFPHWPTLGALNLPQFKAAIMLHRIQMKQWKRTYNHRQLRITIPRKWELAKKVPALYHLHSNDPTVVEPAFEPEYPRNTALAAELFNDGWVSVALNPRIIVTNTQPRLVYYRGELSGKIVGGSYEPIDPRLTPRIEKAFPGGISL